MPGRRRRSLTWLPGGLAEDCWQAWYSRMYLRDGEPGHSLNQIRKSFTDHLFLCPLALTWRAFITQTFSHSNPGLSSLSWVSSTGEQTGSGPRLGPSPSSLRMTDLLVGLSFFGFIWFWFPIKKWREMQGLFFSCKSIHYDDATFQWHLDNRNSLNSVSRHFYTYIFQSKFKFIPTISLNMRTALLLFIFILLFIEEIFRG